MAGIQSLMQPQGQQGPMPGQAPQQPMPGMMPKPGASTPAAEVNRYAGKQLPELIALFQQRPSGPLLSKITEATQAAELAKAQANQMAMGQAQQQSGTIRDMALGKAMQAMQPTQMAANGGIMQGYAGGGAVAFKYGGAAVQHFKDGSNENGVQSFMERFPKDSGARRLYEWIKAGRPPLEKPILDALLQKEQQVVAAQEAPAAPTAARPDFPRFTSQELERFVTSPSAPPAPAPSPAGPRRQPMAGPAPAAPAPALAPTPSSGISPEMEAYFRNRASELRTRQGIPEDVASGRAGLEALARENIAAQRGEAETFGREARERRDAALARSQRGILDDPQALLALAGSIDTRKGQGVGSLARGTAGMLGQREAAAEAAKEKYATAQQTERAMQANIRNTNMLEAQRAQALREGDFNRANQIKDQIDALMMQRETLLMERKDKAIEQQRLSRGLDIQERGVRAQEVSANKPTGTVALLRELGLAPTLENLGKVVEAQQGPKSSAAMRKELVEQWSKNIMLQQKFPNFEDFVAAMAAETGAAGAGGGEFIVRSSRPK